MTHRTTAADRSGHAPAGAAGCVRAVTTAPPTAGAAEPAIPHPGEAGPVGCAPMFPLTMTARDPYARLARGCRPRGCRAPARRVHGRRVRYVIGDEPGQVNGMRWPRPVSPAVS
ncbi:tryptophan biosynthesis modulator TrpM [Streptomyces heilongjiangensis]|uniref:tryptophan biosynthesis modulator TrpM n=1 Tax=Streptomyces TaxID=1883 RepID=UPI003A8C9FA7